MISRVLAVSVLVAAVALSSSADIGAAASLTAPVTGTFAAPSGSGPINGAFTLEGFANQEDELVALGTVSYSLCIPDVDPKNCLATVTQDVALPVAAIAVSCEELRLTLEPTTLVSPPTLPGFTIRLDAIVFDLTAGSHPAQDLLCAVAHRVDASGASGEIAPMLTQFIRVLGDS
jgi:hypothetical protein